MTPESRLQKRAITFARSQGVVVIRLSFVKGASAGWPDVLFLGPSRRLIFVEFKAPGKKPTPLQAHRLKQLSGLGYDVLATDSFDEARDAIASAMDSAAVHGARRAASPRAPRRRTRT